MNTLILLAFMISALGFGAPAAAQDDSFTDEPTGLRYRLETYQQAQFPLAMAFAPDGRLFYNEKITGNVRVVSADGQLQPDPVISFEVSALQERGLLGLALDPAYADNGLMWAVYTAPGTASEWPANVVVRFHEADGIGSDAELMLSVPIENGNLLHNGGNLHFDEAGLLYLSLGDYGEAFNSQDLTTMPGKIHRFEVTADGLQAAPGNPHDNSIYAHGLRNSFDFTFDPLSGNLFAAESGPDCDDEINLILPGFNYGWGEDYACVGTDRVPGLTLYAPPLLSFTPPEAPTGIVVYDHPAAPQWQGDLFFCGWNYGTLWRAELNEGRSRVDALHEIDLGDAQCRLDLAQGPDGALYFGTVGADGGAIMRLLPLAD